MTLDICEIFSSIQGESTYQGLACTFIRTSGCNLNCSWCDTLYSKTESVSMTLDDILSEVDRLENQLVEVTGGEPLLQTATPVLITRLLDRGHIVLLETNGSISIKAVDTRCVRIVDVKCPSSNMSEQNNPENPALLTHLDEVKFVIADRADYLFAKQRIQSGELATVPPGRIHLSPVLGRLEPAELAGWMLEDAIGARLSLQIHKLIWHPDQRGV